MSKHNPARISFLCGRMMLLFYIFLACTVVQTLFAVWMLWTSGGSADKTPAVTVKQEALSIIICAKNEAKNLNENLPSILAQNHPDFEVIVVDDASEDETAGILARYRQQHPSLVVVSIPKEVNRNLPGKKFALSKGLIAAKNERILLCDADCRPSSGDWAVLMNTALNAPKEIIAGYGAYIQEKGCLNTFIRWETLHTFIQYSTYTRSGIPYMAVGRNLACKKHILEAVQSDPLWASMPSGDDDLLIRLAGQSRNVGIEAAKGSFTCSKAENTLSGWIRQKQRHLSTGKLYKKQVQLLLGIYALSHGLLWLLWLVLWLAGYGYLVSSLMLLRCMLVWSLWAGAAHAMREKKIILWFPFCDIGWAFYNLLLSPYIFYKTKQQWK